MNSKLLTKILALFITVVLLALLFTQINYGDVITTLKNINSVYIVVGFILYTCSYFLRALRFHLLLNKEVSIKNLFHIECVHNMMNNLLPARTGELSYVYLLKTEQNKTTGEGLATLIIARIFDFIIITILFLALFIFIGNLTSGFILLVIIGIIFLLSMVVLLIAMLFFGDDVLLRSKKFLMYFNFKKIQLGTYITKKSEETLTCLKMYKSGKFDQHLSVILLSIGIWALSYLLFYLIAISMNLDLGVIPILFASSFAVFSTVLPIQGIGGFGTMEGGWALGFIAVGATKDVAINTGFGFHLIILMYTIFLGISGYLKIFLLRNEKNEFTH